MDHTINITIDDARNSFLETYNLALTYANKDADDCAKTLLSLYEDTMKIKENGKCYDLALEKARMQTTLEDFDKVYNEEVEQIKKPTQIKKTKEFKEFQDKLKEIKNAFEQKTDQAGTSQQQLSRIESDELVMETEICTTDPLTKRRMQNPIKNKICGHYYEESSILEAIKINPRLRCPVAGCGNNKFVQKKDLVSDEQFKLQLTNMYSQELCDDDPLC